MNKKDLIDLAMSMDTQKNYESLYRFGQNFVFHITQKGLEDTSSFFDCIKYCYDKPGSVKNRLGIGGSDVQRLKQWSKYINEKSDLKSLSAVELNYLLACCARLCKAK